MSEDDVWSGIIAICIVVLVLLFAASLPPGPFHDSDEPDLPRPL